MTEVSRDFNLKKKKNQVSSHFKSIKLRKLLLKQLTKKRTDIGLQMNLNVKLSIGCTQHYSCNTFIADADLLLRIF